MRKGAVEAARLRGEGLLYRQIADRMGLAVQTVSDLITDPDGAKVRERKARYSGTCEVCGGATNGTDGRAKAPKRCLKCRPRAEHGSSSRYASGCRCDDCRRWSRDYKRAMKDKTPPSHGSSGYTNYGCRCDVCRQAQREKNHAPQQAEYKRRWVESVFGTVPPRHGTVYIYKTYGCRCSDCTAAATAADRAKRARRKARSG